MEFTLPVWNRFGGLRFQALKFLAKMAEVIFGFTHPLTSLLQSIAAENMLQRAAELSMKVILRKLETLLGPTHPQAFLFKRRLCYVLDSQGDTRMSEECLRSMLEQSSIFPGPGDSQTWGSHTPLAYSYHIERRLYLKIKTIEDPLLLSEIRSMKRSGDLAIRRILCHLFSISTRSVDYAKVEHLALEILDAYIDKCRTKHPSAMFYVDQLRDFYLLHRRFSDASALEEKYPEIFGELRSGKYWASGSA